MNIFISELNGKCNFDFIIIYIFVNCNDCFVWIWCHLIIMRISIIKHLSPGFYLTSLNTWQDGCQFPTWMAFSDAFSWMKMFGFWSIFHWSASLGLHELTHWGRVTHICVGKLTIIRSDNGLSPEWRQAIIWTNAGILLIGPLGTIFSEILIEIQTFSFKKMHLKISSAKWRPFCLGLNVLSGPVSFKRAGKIL